jgi:lysophospholipase L1-like esterase
MRLLIAVAVAAVALFVALAAGGFVARRAWIDRKVAALHAPPTLRFVDANAALPAKDGRRRVALIGDSSVARWPKADLSDAWAFVNRGVGGETTEQVAGRFDADALALQPDVIVLWAGINDLVAAEFLDPAGRQAAIDATVDRLSELARRADAQGARVLLATVVPPTRPELLRWPVWREGLRDAVAEVNQRLRAFGAASGIEIVDFAAALSSDDRRTPDAYRADALHLNATAYRKLSDVLRRALRE